jgi:hypothetical protein
MTTNIDKNILFKNVFIKIQRTGGKNHATKDVLDNVENNLHNRIRDTIHDSIEIPLWIRVEWNTRNKVFSGDNFEGAYERLLSI